MLEKMPHHMISESRMNPQPIIFDTTDNEGYGFIPFVFWGINQNVTVIEAKFHLLIDFLFQDDSDVVKHLYPCPRSVLKISLSLNSTPLPQL